MSMIIEQTKEFLNREAPALKNWIPCKEQQIAGTSSDISDYASGLELIGSRDLYKTDAATVFANIVTGTAAQGNDWTDAGNVGLISDVGVNESFITLCISDNQDDANSFVWAGRNNGASGIRFADAGAVMSFRDSTATITDTSGAILAGIVCQYMGFNRNTLVAEFGEITALGAVTAKREVDASAFDGLLIEFGAFPANNGLIVYGGSGGSNPATVYSFIHTTFTSDYPTYEGESGFAKSLIDWRASVVAGSKILPPFIMNLT